MAEGAPLLREYGSKAHRGFESLSLRQVLISPHFGGFLVPDSVRGMRTLIPKGSGSITGQDSPGRRRRRRRPQGEGHGGPESIPLSPPDIKSPAKAGFFISVYDQGFEHSSAA